MKENVDNSSNSGRRRPGYSLFNRSKSGFFIGQSFLSYFLQIDLQMCAGGCAIVASQNSKAEILELQWRDSEFVSTEFDTVSNVCDVKHTGRMLFL